MSSGVRGAGQRAALAEGVGLWAVAFVLVLGLALGSLAWGVVASNLYALVAAVFVGVPLLWSERVKQDWSAWGVHTEGLRRQVGWGLGAALVTLVGFAPGYHLWQVEARGLRHDPGWDNLYRWSASDEGAPLGWGQEAGAWVYTQRDALHVGLRATPEQGARVVLRAHKPFTVRALTDGVLVRALKADGEPRRGGGSEQAAAWEVLATAQHKAGAVAIAPEGRAPVREVQIEAKAVGDDAPVRLYRGPTAQEVERGGLEARRDLWWLALWALTQLFLIAWPEEVFYRGLVQTRLMAGLQEGGERLPWRAITLTSVLFGLGHLLVPVQGALLVGRASVFFPSLVFGWLRWRTGSVVAPAVYHACCNMMVLALATQYR